MDTPELTLDDIFTDDIVEFLKNNKEHITSELLEEIRSFGNEGKHLALEILDFPKDSEQYYLDSFGNRISFNGNRKIKKPFTKLDLSPIHIEELTKCSNDIHYFKDNYVKIRTKSGVNFPEVRDYQNRFISLLNSEEESIVGLMGRQSSKSISTSIYLNHLIIFDKEKNIGIVANKGGLAREFLSNVKNIFTELPIWMQVGCKSWNKSFIEFENEMRCLTDVPSQDSFRGYSIHCLDGKSLVDVYDKKGKEYFNISLEDLYKSNHDNYLIKTQSGYKDFLGVRKTENAGVIIRTAFNEIRCTGDHRILVGKNKSGKIYRKAKNIKIDNYIKKSKVQSVEIDNTVKYYYDPIEVSDGNHYLSEGVTHHNCAVIDETAFIRPSIFSEFIDAFLPSQAALSWKKNIILSTPKGQNHFFDIVKGASLKYGEDGSGIKEKGNTGYVLFKVDWRDVPRYDKNGSVIDPEIFKDNIIKKHGLLYWNQNFACEFLGSSHTLVDAGALEKFISQEPQEIRDGKLKIYKYPEKGHQYICSVDAAKDGIDDFSVQILDITDFKFEQVASAQLQIDYLLMPEYINDWCEYYNKPYLIIENNEGAGQSIADQMYQTYEYENLHFDKDPGTKKKKKYPGFRTSTRTRKLILQTLKLFIENNNLIIIDKKTINQFYTFILLNNKYQADENCKDDAIMSLAIAFAPFCNSKNFEDMKGLVERLYNEFDDTDESKDKSFTEFLTIGSFDDGVDEDFGSSNSSYIDSDGFY